MRSPAIGGRDEDEVGPAAAAGPPGHVPNVGRDARRFARSVRSRSSRSATAKSGPAVELASVTYSRAGQVGGPGSPAESKGRHVR